ncbi:MAG: MBL fold metallo-hydrolase [Lachnoclostridium sp.]|jgi:glyoxylase-like metal-dependent hydrolase (beta-lactamase superfamily II)|nr:MBL fold metallo-hydrolase [Lachnoclostridium sp.]
MDNKIKDLNIRNIVVGPVETNCYIVNREGFPECFVIDPGDESEKILSFIEAERLEAKSILLTHGHFDHILAVEDVQKKMNAKLYAGKEERDLLKNTSLNNPIRYPTKPSLEADIECSNGQIIEVAGLTIKVIATPGHTSGCVCYYLEDYGVLFSGDTLFLESIGRTDFPTGDSQMILHSIKERLFVLPDDVIVLPGHDSKTSIGHEKKHNPHFGMGL